MNIINKPDPIRPHRVKSASSRWATTMKAVDRWWIKHETTERKLQLGKPPNYDNTLGVKRNEHWAPARRGLQELTKSLNKRQQHIFGGDSTQVRGRAVHLRTADLKVWMTLHLAYSVRAQRVACPHCQQSFQSSVCTTLKYKRRKPYSILFFDDAEHCSQRRQWETDC